MPPTVVYRTSGTMSSPCPPSTYACTSSIDTCSSWEIKVRNRAVSKTPAIPKTRFLGNPLVSNTFCTIASKGLVTAMIIQLGEYLTTS